MRSTIRIAALALVLAALAVLPAGTELRAHSPGSATLTDLALESGSDGGTAADALPDVPAARWTIPTRSTWRTARSQVTIEGTADGDGTVTYQYTDADSGTIGHQVNLPTLGSKLIDVTVSHLDTLGRQRRRPTPWW